jgi:hypothetical protein
MSPCGSIKLGIHDTTSRRRREQNKCAKNEIQFSKHEVAFMPASLTKTRHPAIVDLMQHELIDEMSLALGRRVAERLSRQPELLQIARANLDRWSARNAGVSSLLRCYAEWRVILERPLEDICGVLTEDTEEARRLRQNSPFAGILTPREVWDLKRSVRHEPPSA